MQRDAQQFPADDNGDVLWKMFETGDDLAESRDIEFSVVFPTEDDALRFSVRFLRNGYKVQIHEYEGQRDGLTWDVTVYNDMVPTHAGITEFEGLLAEQASGLGGKNDGWGCFYSD